MNEILLVGIGFFTGIFINQIISLLDSIFSVITSNLLRLTYKKEEKQKVGFINE